MSSNQTYCQQDIEPFPKERETTTATTGYGMNNDLTSVTRTLCCSFFLAFIIRTTAASILYFHKKRDVGQGQFELFNAI